MNLDETIIGLSIANGPSGYEREVVNLISSLLQPYVDDIKTDSVGNLIAMRYSKIKNAPTVMIEAHMDEIGFIITGYDNGFLRFSSIGGIDAKILPALEVMILCNTPIYGVIDVLPPHLLTKEEQEKPIGIDKLFIDTGIEPSLLRERIPLGTPVVFLSEPELLNNDKISGKALDNRVGVAAVLNTLKYTSSDDLKCNIAAVFSSQEEVGCRGIVPAVYSVSPDYAIVFDATFGKAPDTLDHESFRLNGGPGIAVGPNINRVMSESLINIAQNHKIPYSVEVIHGNSGTDAWPTQISREGIATALVSIPLKYMHTPYEIVDIRDVDNASKLAALWIQGLDSGEKKW